MGKESALQLLATTAPRDWCLLNGEGARRFLEVLTLCVREKLVDPASLAQDDVGKLQSLFDVALQHGLGCVVYDYVAEVCCDRYLSSSDTVTAFLMDGQCVKQWCKRVIHGVSVRINKALTQGFASANVVNDLAADAGRLNILALIMQALEQPGPSPQNSPVSKDMEEVLQLQQCLKVIEWLSAQKLDLLRFIGRFSSEQEWRSTVNKRRDACAPLSLFIHDMLNDFQIAHGGKAVKYPPKCLNELLREVFLSGFTSAAASDAKLALLLYTLLDMAHPISPESFQKGFGVAPSTLAVLQAQFWLDDAALESGWDSLEQACCLMPGAATADTPFKIVEALAARGRSEAALAVLRARAAGAQQPQDAVALSQASTGLKVRLECGLLSEAFQEVRQHCARVSPAVRAEHTLLLIRQLAQWAAVSQGMASLFEMPISPAEEEVLVGWMEEKALEGAFVAQMLPVYYLQRGRSAEALYAHARLQQAPETLDIDGMEEEGAEERAAALCTLRELLRSAAGALPTPQRGLLVAPPDSGPALQLISKPLAAIREPRGLPILSGLPDAPSIPTPAWRVCQMGSDPPPLLVSGAASLAETQPPPEAPDAAALERLALSQGGQSGASDGFATPGARGAAGPPHPSAAAGGTPLAVKQVGLFAAIGSPLVKPSPAAGGRPKNLTPGGTGGRPKKGGQVGVRFQNPPGPSQTPPMGGSYPSPAAGVGGVDPQEWSRSMGVMDTSTPQTASRPKRTPKRARLSVRGL